MSELLLKPPIQPSQAERVVVLSHGHPDYSLGGAEMAAYSLYQALRRTAPADTYLISAISPERARGFSGARLIRIADSPYEWAFISEGTGWPYFDSLSVKALQYELVPFIRDIEPDVVHLHHFMGFGLDIIRLIRRAMPRVKIVFTLHEYLAICTRDGQMLTTPANNLCEKASPIRCTGCFPEFLRSQIWLREQWFKRHFEEADVFTSPSEFTRRRYIEWGISPERIKLVENAQLATRYPVPLQPRSGASKPVFAFFGQINPYKGAEVVLDAAERLAGMTEAPFEIRIHGVLRDYKPGFKEAIQARLAELSDVVSYRGAYDPARVISLMQSADYVLVPSIWWENSPVVIEEAFHAGRPVICADIGGMREKVEDGVAGLHFRARDADSLAAVLLRCIENPDLAETLAGGVRTLPTLADSDRQYRAVYAGLAANDGGRRARAGAPTLDRTTNG